MLGMNRNTLRAKLVKHKLSSGRRCDVDGHVRRALLSRLGQARPRRFREAARRRSASRSCPPAAPRVRSPRRASPVTDVGRLHRLSRDARRPREDAASEGARRHPRAPRRARRMWLRCASTASRPIDLVVVNLYPFRADGREARLHARRRDREHRHRRPVDGARGGEELAARRRWSSIRPITPACSPSCSAARRALSRRRRAFGLCAKAFAHTASLRRRDRQLADARATTSGAARRCRTLQLRSASKLQDLRYGENPHQSAAFYRDETPAPGSIATYRQLQGKELSYNNIADSDAAWECVKTFAEPALRDRQARQSRAASPSRRRRSRRIARRSRPIPTSAFGGIIAFNRPRRRGDGRGRGGAVPRSADRARLHRRRARG